MDEYISREKAINAIKSLESSMSAKDNYAKGYDAALGRALIAVREAPPAADVQPVNQWISIDERLPQDGEEALVYAGNRGVMIGLYDSVLQVWLDYECCGLKVTHWQPLPEPPKKEG